MIKQERKCSGERERERERKQESNPVLFRHHCEFAQKSVSLVFIDMIQEPSATVVGLHLHLKTLSQKTNTSLELLALPLSRANDLGCIINRIYKSVKELLVVV